MSHHNLIDKIHHDDSTLEESNMSTDVHWIAGHVKLPQSKLADIHAKLEARGAAELDPNSQISLQAAKSSEELCTV